MAAVTFDRRWYAQHVGQCLQLTLPRNHCAYGVQALQNDPWLKEHGILPPGHRDAPETCGAVFWKLIDNVLQEVSSEIDGRGAT